MTDAALAARTAFNRCLTMAAQWDGYARRIRNPEHRADYLRQADECREEARKYQEMLLGLTEKKHEHSYR